MSTMREFFTTEGVVCEYSVELNGYVGFFYREGREERREGARRSLA